MSYLVGEMGAYLLVAAIIGALIGLVFKSIANAIKQLLKLNHKNKH